MKSSLLERTDVKSNSKEALKKRTEFIEGCKSGVPIAVGYIPIAVAFGLLAKSSGVPDYICIMMSAFVFAGASQFVGVNLMAMGAAPWEIIMTTLLLKYPPLSHGCINFPENGQGYAKEVESPFVLRHNR